MMTSAGTVSVLFVLGVFTSFSASAGDFANAFRCNDAKPKICIQGAQTLAKEVTVFEASGSTCVLKTEKVFQFQGKGVTFEATAVAGKACSKLRAKTLYAYLGTGKLGIKNLNLKSTLPIAEDKSARSLLEFLDPSAKAQAVKLYRIGDHKRYLAQSLVDNQEGKVQIFDIDHRRQLTSECTRLGDAFLLNGETYFDLSTGGCGGSASQVDILYEVVPGTLAQEILHNVTEVK